MLLNGGHTTFLLVFIVVLVFRCIKVVAPNCEGDVIKKRRGPNHIVYSVGSIIKPACSLYMKDG